MRTAIVLCLVALAVLPLTAATFTRNAPTTTNNDDSCDIGLYPAATLLLPFFEVSQDAGGKTAIVTITNTTNLPQATRVTLWTDWGYPVISLPVYLTGYDVQSLNLHDIIFQGRVAPDFGTGSDRSPIGELSGTGPTTPFDNPFLVESSCTNLPLQLPPPMIERLVRAFTIGRLPTFAGDTPECTVGYVHPNAIGYATIDVTGVCGNSLPIDNSYFTAEIGYDNVLMGDYLQVSSDENLAQGGPLVHIRAVPEGGTPGTRRPTNLARTFYSRLLPAVSRTLDGRQPLPSTFAARWIAGGPTTFETFFKIWREGRTPADTACAIYANNSAMPFPEVLRFDEEENVTVLHPPITITPLPEDPFLPATSIIASNDVSVLPPNVDGGVGGWMYFNLDNGAFGDAASQNWVIVSMRAEGRFSVDSDALALGNGCSAPTDLSEVFLPSGKPIGPAPNTTP